MQRQDIDEIYNDRLTLAIDEENIAESPYSYTFVKGTGNNWIQSENGFVKFNVSEDEQLVLQSSALTNLSQKNITDITVSFDYTCNNFSSSYPILNNVALVSEDNQYSVLSETALNSQGHIDVTCQKFGLDSQVLNTAITDKAFGIELNIVGNKSNVILNIVNAKLVVSFTDKLGSEIDAVANRLVPSFDFFRIDDELIIDIGDGTGGGSHHSGSDIDYEEVERMIKQALNRLGVDLGLDLLDNGYLKISAEINNGDV